MKTIVVEVGGLLSVLSAEGVQRQLQKLRGVHHAEVNYVAQCASVHYDDKQIGLDEISQRIVECGYHCRGEMVPDHLCMSHGGIAQTAVPAVTHGHPKHRHEAAPGAIPPTGFAAPPSAAVAHADHAAHGAAPKKRGARQTCNGRHDARRGPSRRHVDAGHGPRHAQSLRRSAGLRDSCGQLLANGKDVRRLPHAFRYGAQAILARAGAGMTATTTEFTNIDGQGAKGVVGGKEVLLGNRKLMHASAVALGGLLQEADRLQGGGRTVVHVASGRKLLGLIAIADASRPTSKATVEKLQERGVKVAMLSGDNQATAARIAGELGIDIVLADVLPGQKAEKIKELQSQGHKVGMVDDGVNVAPALTQADVGIAIGAGTDVAMESAQVVLMKSDPFDVVGAIELSHATPRKMHQNLWWAVGYKTVAFPRAAGVFYRFTLSPAIADLSMSGSSAIVAINALMLKRTRLTGIKSPSPHPPAAGLRAATTEAARRGSARGDATGRGTPCLRDHAANHGSSPPPARE